uniref:AlNc14C40G3400 protein n=1 Tax=Albugo laibachii Nc14 TaxID=890382 RepID=F0W9E1_9STRA|nr:AlNc14C40G3400 [Albugo laibachii Nc14]|eukprot:CCA17755.1 AlNc14C40G3400 [Albugo laibachii Nc14]
MASPITVDEIKQAFWYLQNNHAPGADHFLAELLKHSPTVVAVLLAEAINRHVQNPTASMKTNLGPTVANWYRYLATPKTYSNENLTQQQLSDGFENFSSILIFFRKH